MLGEAAVPEARPAPRARAAARGFMGRQDTHSWFLISSGLLLIGTLVIDLLLHRENIDPAVLIVLFTAAVALSVSAVLLGKRFPLWMGLSCVAILALASIYFISPAGDAQSAVSSMQELPILALYLAWFVRRPLNRVLLLTSIAAITAVMFVNPAFHFDGDLGVAVAIQSLVAALFCFEVGQALWRRTEHKVATDVLTGALNRAGFMKRLEEEVRRSERANTPLSLVVIDFDDFKQINDTEGHAAGDQALIDTVQHWNSGLRQHDVVGRTGGDEFAMLITRTGATDAQRTMLRLREHSPHAWSWGVSQLRDGDTIESLFDRADRRLYAVKRGRT